MRKARIALIAMILIALVVVCYCVSSNSRARSVFERLCPVPQPVPESERLLVDATLERHQITNTTLSTRVPQFIYQTNSSSRVPKKMKDAMDTILSLNPAFAYLYYTDDMARDFIAENYPDETLQAYNDLLPGAFKADLFRYILLYLKGGVYIDSSMTAKLPLASLLRRSDTFVSCEDDGHGGVYNAFIACSPNHPILRKAIELTVRNVRQRYYGTDPLEISGPLLLARAFRQIVGRECNPDTDYGNGVRLLKYARTEICTTGGVITDRGRVIMVTKYPGYTEDRSWYSSDEHYSKMWKQRRVYVD